MDELTLIKNAILADIPSVETMYLFGSRARGDAREDSDYDIFLVVSNDSLRPLEVMQMAHGSIGRLNLGSPVDVLAMRESDFRERRVLPTIERTIAREGVLFYEHAVCNGDEISGIAFDNGTRHAPSDSISRTHNGVCKEFA